MNEPDVTLTDYALAVLCAVLAWWLARGGDRDGLRAWLVLFFASTGVAALLGGVFHGHFEDESRAPGLQLWTGAMLAIGTAAFAGEAAAARLALPPGAARWATAAAGAKLAAFALYALAEPRPFRAAVLDYLPAVLLLLAALAHARARERPGAGRAAAGLVVMLAAAGLQQGRIGVHPVWLDHNALFHVVQAAGLALLYAGARELCGVRPAPARAHPA